MSETSNKQFYVYIYRLLDGTPIYVGKGSRWRFRDHFGPKYKTRLGFKLRKLRKEEGYSLYPEFIFVKDDREGLSLEIALISKFGREDLGTGTLYNLTDGGEGTSGWVMTDAAKERRKASPFVNKQFPWAGQPMPEEIRKKIGDALRGPNSPNYRKKLSPEQVAFIKKVNTGKIMSEEAKAKISLASRGEKNGHFGKPHSEEAKRRMSETKKARSPRRPCPHCGKEGAGSNMSRYHFDNCKHKEKGPDEPGQS